MTDFVSTLNELIEKIPGSILLEKYIVVVMLVLGIPTIIAYSTVVLSGKRIRRSNIEYLSTVGVFVMYLLAALVYLVSYFR
jgi:hypothetical protein